MSETKTGGCLCKAIRYEIAAGATPVYNVICYCENCKRMSGTQMFCASIYPKEAFKVTQGLPKEYSDYQTDSSQPLHRFFCGNCGSSIYALTPLNDGIVSIFSGTIDDVEKWWKPNKEQYLTAKSHWIPEVVLEKMDGVPDKHERGPL